jgi:Glycosyltransferases involved in cell wall biogenesis
MQNHNMPHISFIITYYNLPVEMLNECIDSVLRLSLHPSEREIIVVDDGSDISPMNELMKYGDEIIYVRQKNGGLSAARNKGIDVAAGKYIQFIDADDQLIKKPYEQCLDILHNQKDVDMVLFDFSTDLQVESISESVKPVSGSNYMLNNNIHGTAWGYLFRLSVLGKLRFTPGIYHEDEEFTPQLLLRAENVYPTHFKAYFYNKREGSITSSKNTFNTNKRINDREGVIIRLHELSDKLPHQERLALERRIAQLTMDYIYHVIIETHSEEILNQRLMRLHDKGLFPLPNHDFTKKYTWFRKMTKNSLGRKLLLYTLPLLKRER